MSGFGTIAPKGTRLFLDNEGMREAFKSGDYDDAILVASVDPENLAIEREYGAEPCSWCAELDSPSESCSHCKGAGEIRKATVKAEDGQEVRRFRYVLSNAKRDRHNDSIAIEGWDLDGFHRGTGYGPVLWSHSYNRPPIGRGTAKLLKSKLVGVVEFPAEGVDPFVDGIVRMIEFGALKGCSVGFRPVRGAWEWNETEAGYDFKEQELLEWSIVNVGAHPDALVAASAAGIDTAFLAEQAARDMETFHGKGFWVPEAKAKALMSGLGLGRPAEKLFRLNEGPLEQMVASRVKEIAIEDLDDDTLKGRAAEMLMEADRRGLLLDPAEGETEEKSDAEASLAVPAEPGKGSPEAAAPEPTEGARQQLEVELKVTGELKDSIDQVLAKLTDLDGRVAALEGDPHESEPVLRLLDDPDPVPDEGIDREEIRAAVADVLGPAAVRLNEALTRATGRVD